MDHGKLNENIRLALLWSVLAFKDSKFMTDGIFLDLVIDLRYLNILLLLDEV